MISYKVIMKDGSGRKISEKVFNHRLKTANEILRKQFQHLVLTDFFRNAETINIYRINGEKETLIITEKMH